MANKKITELPLAITASRYDGSTTVLPIVISGTTNQISIENLSNFVNAYNAHTGSAGNTFKGPQTIQSTLSVTGNASVGGNLVVAGRITAEEFHTEITTASVIYASGSTKFGDDTGDKHEFTGSINVSGSLIYNGVTLLNIDANTINRLQQATSSLQAHSASVDAQLLAIQQTTQSLQVATASLQAFSSSVNDQLQRVYQTTQSLHVATASLQAHSASVNAQLLAIQQTTQSLHVATASLQAFSASVNSQLERVYQTTQSLHVATASLQAFTASQDSRNFTISQITSSFAGEIGGLEEYSASLKAAAIVSSSTQIQNYDLFAINSVMYIATGSIKGEIAGIEAYTASLKAAAIVSSSTQVQNYDVFALNSNLYIATGSLIGITNGLMAFTAALDNTYATDAQLYELYAATASLNTTTGSLRDEIAGIEAYTASLKGQAIVSSSTQVQNYDVFALNSNLYTSTGSIKGEIAGIEAYTSSLKAAISVSGTNVQIIGDLNVNKLNVQYISSSVLVTSGSNIFGDQSTDKHEFTGSVYLENSLILGTEVLGNAGLNSVSSSLIGITNELMSYTASLKGAAIVSSSQQIKNYIEFVNNSVTSSMNVNSASIAYKATNVVGSANRILFNNATDTTTTSANLEWNGSKLAVNGDISFGYASTLQSSLDPTNNISLHDGTFGEIRIRNGGTDRITSYRTTDTIKLSGSLVVDGNSPTAKHQISGSLNVSGSSHTIQNGYVILQQVSQSLNFVDDTAAAAGGVPLGGLYRNGNFIVIRIV